MAFCEEFATRINCESSSDRGKLIPSSNIWTEWRFARPGAARRLVTFLARPRKETKRRPPQESRPVFTG